MNSFVASCSTRDLPVPRAHACPFDPSNRVPLLPRRVHWAYDGHYRGNSPEPEPLGGLSIAFVGHPRAFADDRQRDRGLEGLLT